MSTGWWRKIIRRERSGRWWASWTCAGSMKRSPAARKKAAVRDWEERGVWLTIWRAFLAKLNERQQLNWSESFLDGSFAPAKRGLRSRKHQAGQGDEVDGGGRRPRSSSGKPPSLCIPGGSPAGGDHARHDPDRTESSCRPSTAETAAGDCRQSLRQRSAAEAFAAAWNRTDLPTQEESRSPGHPRWPSPAAIQKAMDCRTDQRLARQFPTFGGALRPFTHDLWRLPRPRISLDTEL